MLLPTISASYNDDLFLELCPTYKAAILLLCDIYECFLYKSCRINAFNSNEYIISMCMPALGLMLRLSYMFVCVGRW